MITIMLNTVAHINCLIGMQKVDCMTTTQIVDIVLPLTKADNKCGFSKAKKLRARANLIILINDYKEGKAIVLPEDVLKMLQ